ncbi:MAG TPA: metalloregulator ArsR/SmtB family transcription factor [Symbiobacteriaceae bacterium]|nr:metalloregulator ArsR/SmtB family transcription factor [Symbiobacteriaceae bacterium]
MEKIFDVLADPSRRQILDLLSVRERSVGDLVELTALSQPGVSKHLRVLRDAGLVEVRRDGQRHWYRLRLEPLVALDAWLARYRAFWTDRLDAIERHLDEEGSFMNGIVQRTEAGWVVRFERHLKHPVEKVWAAVTQPERLAAWLAGGEVDLVEGGKIRLTFENTGSVMHGTVTRVEPPAVFEFIWNSEDADDTLVRWEVHPEAGGARLVLTHTFATPDKLPIMMAGWHTHLEGLSQTLTGAKFEWPWARWEELRGWYLKQLR